MWIHQLISGKEYCKKRSTVIVRNHTQEKAPSSNICNYEKTAKVDRKEIKLSLEQLYQRLLVRDNCLMEDVFSYELAAVAPALFLGNGMMHKTNKAELMNALLALSLCILKTFS